MVKTRAASQTPRRELHMGGQRAGDSCLDEDAAGSGLVGWHSVHFCWALAS